MSRRVHMCIAIRTDFIEWKKKADREGYRKTFRKDDGTHPTNQELLRYLFAEEAKGRTAIPMGCPTPNPDGSCPGHEMTDDEAKASP